MVLHVHRSDRADALVSALARLVAEPLPNPLASEVVSVPTRGIERWLTQQLSGHLGVSPGRNDGICANIAFPFPGSLVNGALARAAGADPITDPWLPERAVWPLMEVVEEHFDEDWLAPLAQHMGGPTTVEGSKRFSSVRHVADLFDRYCVHRPDMVQRWSEGDRADGETRWQYELWRLLRRHIGQVSPAERLRDACARLRHEPEVLSEPSRLSLFGLTRLPASYLSVLDAIAEGRDVHLFLLHPSPALWRRLEPQVGPHSRHTPRREDPTAGAARHPLVASWGRDAREMQLVLGAGLAHDVGGPDSPPRTETPTLLHRIQDDIRADRAPVGTTGARSDERPLLAPDDDSIRVHSCHGRARQVEVLRDALLHLFEEDETLEPRDVIVMCPDIEHFAPLIQARFGAHDGEGRLAMHLADRSLRQTNPVMGVLAEVLDLATARLTATQVLDLAGREPVRHRFGLRDDDLSRLEEWIRECRVRWGFDGEHREAFRLGGVDANTWRTGLDRLLLGVTMADERERLFGGVLPLDDVEGGDIDLAGRLAELIDRLRRAVDLLAEQRTVDGWASTLAWIADALTTTSPHEEWQRAELTTILTSLVDEATTNGRVSPVLLGSDDVRSLLSDRLRGRPTRANFRTGQVTVCTLVPMRSIPHRVVCLLGLDDGSFPRHIERDGDDLTAQEPRVGDRDARNEDRQLLLDAFLAARDRLVITYAGHDERSNLPRPPAVPVGELLDVVDRTVRTTDGLARRAVVVTHPLQPFDAKNYESGRLVLSRPWSFDALHLAGARAALSPRSEVPPFLPVPLDDDVASEVIGLDALERFVRHPVRAFLRHRLGVSLWDRTHDPEDAIPIDVDALAKWDIGERVLAARFAGSDWEQCEAAESARGALPPAGLADPILAEMYESIEALLEAAGDSLGDVAVPGAAEPMQLCAELAGLPSVVGTVSGVHGDVLRTVTYRRIQPALRVAAWARLLALTVTEPERPFEAVTVCRSEKGSTRLVAVSRLGPLGADARTRKAVAASHLEELVELFRRGMREPVPLYCKTSEAYASAARSGAEDAEGAAAKQWESRFNFSGEDDDAEHVLVLGSRLTFADMVARSGRLDAAGVSGVTGPTDRSRFAACASMLWDGLLEFEGIGRR